MKATIKVPEPVESEVTLVMTDSEAGMLMAILGNLADFTSDKILHRVYDSLSVLDLPEFHFLVSGRVNDS